MDPVKLHLTFCSQLQDELQEERNRSENLSGALREHESRAVSLGQDRQNVLDNIARLEEGLRQRDEELATYSQRIADREAETEHLQEEISNLRREYSHIADEQNKALQDVSLREGEARSQLEALIRRNAESDVEIDTMKDKVTALKDEVERLRRQVHELQQESADKEVKIVQLTKQRAQDKEDMQGINIALDSKQQELELVRDSISVITLVLIPFSSLRDEWEFEERQAAHQHTLIVPLINANLVHLARLPHPVPLVLLLAPPLPCPMLVPLPKAKNYPPKRFRRLPKYLL
jgi:chromosome segregation ATPase